MIRFILRFLLSLKKDSKITSSPSVINDFVPPRLWYFSSFIVSFFFDPHGSFVK